LLTCLGVDLVFDTAEKFPDRLYGPADNKIDERLTQDHVALDQSQSTLGSAPTTMQSFKQLRELDLRMPQRFQLNNRRLQLADVALKGFDDLVARGGGGLTVIAPRTKWSRLNELRA
jgi:hypothetical protein